MTTVTIIVRHSAKCKYAGDEFFKRCLCPKHFRWTAKGKQNRKAAGTRSWSDAERLKRDLEDQLSGKTAAPSTGDPIAQAVAVFLTDKQVQGVSRGVLSKYTLELARLRDFCEDRRVYTVQGITRELLTAYCETWAKTYPSSTTRAKVRERCRSFLRYCYEAKYLDRIPQLPKMKIDEAPTMPLTPAEYTRLLDALYVVNPRRWDGKLSTQPLTAATRQRIAALIQLMRFTGLAIRDAVTLERSGIRHAGGLYLVTTSRQKTGTDVAVPIPPAVAAEILAVESVNPKYIFWTGQGRAETTSKTWANRYMRPLFEAAGLESGHMVSHRLRDTFAVDLLEKGVPMEEVSKLLGHTSIKTTEKHYAKWVKGRQDRLNSLVTGTW